MSRRLLLAENVFDQLDGGKNVTIRKGRRDIMRGGLIFESVDKGRERLVEVGLVYYAPLRNVLLEDYVNDGFKDKTDMLTGLRKFYPDINMETEMTVVRFKLIQ